MSGEDRRNLYEQLIEDMIMNGIDGMTEAQIEAEKDAQLSKMSLLKKLFGK